MVKRRHFLKASAAGLLSNEFILSDANAAAEAGAVVKQPEQCDTYWVRENTPITIHLSKTTDHVSSVSVCTQVLSAGAGIPTHKHIHADEYFFFISGSGTIVADDVETPFKTGTCAFVPKNTWHSLKNTGSEPVTIQFGFSPAGFEDFFRQIGTPKTESYKQKPKAEFDAIAKKFGMVFK